MMTSKGSGADSSPKKGEDDTFIARRSYVSNIEKKSDSSNKNGMFWLSFMY